ncbi:methyltransferase domain-containing protein [Autumnicola musiva]|uniref:Methyltransferase domain-containing protein n=1 Tax=Autumnicola musiva TaxID=3075589 RepID=A0ABU3DAM0_9FLAO|nr:methyltransferase domain-containing protein [Zunongwangia sp. F117]MDT0678586.1 methyltransferase domain-containing protein [Zunongwangia sp. F117]
MSKKAEAYWSKRYLDSNTGWDIGHISTPVREYVDQLKSKDLKILIPGAGNGYEAEYLFNNGFYNVYVADIAREPLLNLKKRQPGLPENQLLHQDFFEINDCFDLIIEQTFFCAIPVKLRKDYAQKAYRLLNENGKITGLVFNFPLTKKGPPFGGSKEEYLTYFRPYFEIKTLEICYNSIPSREGNELFFSFIKKKQI